MAYCRDCSKLTGVEQGDPELNVEMKDLIITGSCRVFLTCTECGSEVRQKEFDVDVNVAPMIEEHEHKCPEAGTGVGWHLAEESVESTVRTHPPNAKRYATFYGFEATFTISCNCDEQEICEATASDECKASEMEEV